jgi:anti-sigma B factor antagonist
MIDSPLVIEVRNGIHVVTCERETCLDAPMVQLVQDELNALLDPDMPRHLLFDLGQATFVSSPALTMLIHLRRAAEQLGREVVLAGMQPHVRRLFAITRLDKIFAIHATPEGALAHLTGGTAADPAAPERV